MQILFLCGVFAKENEMEILNAAKKPIEYSANIFQEKLIKGFEKYGEKFTVLSAPFIGSFPNASRIFNFSGFKKNSLKYKYVSFNNIWGLRNFSRARSLKKGLNEFINSKEENKIIVVYCLHTPFLEAAVYAKKRDPQIKICLIVPDLMQYMNLNDKISILYKIGKKYDIQKCNRLNRFVDAYMFLTEPMAKVVNKRNKPYIVVEGIVDEDIFDINKQRKKLLDEYEKKEKYIVYTGRVSEKFGVKNLIDVFNSMPEEELRLIICGDGDLCNYAEKKAEEDKRIHFLGQVTPDIANDWILKADVLVNPREDNDEYTKYSFPSKNIEYLSSGNKVVAYKLSGMSEVYSDFMYCVNGNLRDTIYEALVGNNKNKSFEDYAINNLSAKVIAGRIVKLVCGGEQGE